jgi:hypothetical protein
VVGDDLADAYRYGAAYLREAIDRARGRRTDPPPSGQAALTAGLRLEEAVRGFLAEQGTKHLSREEFWRLIGGTLRLRLTAASVAHLPPACANADQPEFEEIERRADELIGWYERLAVQVGRPRDPVETLAAPQPGDGTGGSSGMRGAIWLREHVEHLAEHVGVLTDPATRLAEARRQPWWR